MRAQSVQERARAVEAMALGVLRDTPLCAPRPDEAAWRERAQAWIDEFRDEAGHRRPVDGVFLAAMMGLEPLPATREEGGDVRLWRAALGEGGEFLARVETASGPIWPEARAHGLEAWTEIELSSLHALRRLAVGRQRLLARCNDAARWIIAELQPDNATGHPWAWHVFEGLRAASPEAGLYADTLLHNCQVSLGRPDRFSACVLLEAARTLLRAPPGAA